MSKSLKTRLLRNLMLTLSLGWVITLLFGYALTQRTLNRQLDAQLQQIAQSLSTEPSSDEREIEVSEQQVFFNGKSEGVEFQIWHDDKIVRYSANAPREQLSPEEGFSQSEVGQKKWRVYSALRDHSRVQVGEDLDVRGALVRGMIVSSLWPMAVAWPLIALILWISVGSALRPLSALAGAIQSRSPTQLSKIEVEGIPSEVMPVVHSLNDLLSMVKRAFEREKQFTENAAHELRTPLAGIKAQAEAALGAQNEADREEGLKAINSGVDRASRMVGQLLTLARLDPEDLVLNFEEVDLGPLVSRVVAKFFPQASRKGIDIGISQGAGESFLMKGEAGYLEILLSNLVDNAIRYSKDRGVIDISLAATFSGTLVTIRDSGPGIPPGDRARVFERFVRLPGGSAEGSGIGLAIVKKIAELHEIQIEFGEGAQGRGLEVKLHCPKA